MSDSINKPREFGKVRELLWPIRNFELKKFIPMSFLLVGILFTYTMLRDFKDVLIQDYANGGGAMMFPLLKLFFVMPVSFLLVMFYTKLVSKYGFNKTFYIMVSCFACWYLLFGFVLFPNRDLIHPSVETVRAMQAASPGFLYYIIPCVTNWSFSLFYVLAELWGTMAIASLFWRFANQITKKEQVKRFFPMYPLLGNLLGVITSGSLLAAFSRAEGKQLDLNYQFLISICIAACFATMGIFWWINKNIMTDPMHYDPKTVVGTKKKEKVKMGAMEGIKYLFTNNYMLLISALVFGYGMLDNLIEVVWKNRMKIDFPAKGMVGQFMGMHSIFVGVFSVLVSFLGVYLMRKLKWRGVALVTPITGMVVGALFFSTLIYIMASGNGNVMIFGMSLNMLMIYIGVIGVAFFKAIKYTTFDPTKSMAYIPLDDDAKTKGQAAVEVVGGRAGKAGGATVTTVLTNFVAPASAISQHLAFVVPIVAVVGISWITAVFGLSKKYEKKLEEQGVAEELA